MNQTPVFRNFSPFLLAALLWVAPWAGATEPESASGEAAGQVQILFLPPPMEGTVSLGIYNAEGKRVRTLHREAEFDEFVKAFNGLITHWDGRNDAGELLPAGKYHARGYLVGDLGIDGVGFEGNDWVTDQSAPRLLRIRRIAALPGEAVLLEADTPQGEARFIAAPGKDAAGEVTWQLSAAPTETAFPEAVEGTAPPALPEETAGETDAYPLVALASAPEERDGGARLLYALGANENGQQLRGVEVVGEEVRPVFEKVIRYSERLEQALPWLQFPNGKPFVPATTLTVTLRKNPLLEKKGRPKATFRVETTPNGMVLETSDGLPLFQISDTRHLRWTAFGQPEGERAVTFFESDGAVVAEYRANALTNLMSFDIGVVEWKGASSEETPATPDVTPSPGEPGTPVPSASSPTEAAEAAPPSDAVPSASPVEPAPAQTPPADAAPAGTAEPAGSPAPAAPVETPRP